MSRSELRPDDSPLEPALTIEQHILAGFPPELALDLVLNELVVRAAQATHAPAAALALARGDEMVCRATTGQLAPDLGAPINTRDGLSGACLETRQPQMSVDTEFDPRIDPAISRLHGIRSILIVPVFESNHPSAKLSGVLEVFSPSPAAFSHYDQRLLEDFADECVRIRQAAFEISQRQPAARLAPADSVTPEFITPDFIAASSPPAGRPPYEVWTLVLGGLAILAIIAVTFLIGSRLGWLGPPRAASSTQNQPPETSSATTAARRAIPSSSRKRPEKTARKTSEKTASRSSPAPAPSSDDLLVYEKGKVIFRLKPDSTEPHQANLRKGKPKPAPPNNGPVVEASATTKIAPAQTLWLSPDEAETRLLRRSEPQYPPAAITAHIAGDVILEVQIAEDGSVSRIRTLSGDPLLAAAAAEAVRAWRYQPYRQNGRPSQFQTDVTLTFTLPD